MILYVRLHVRACVQSEDITVAYARDFLLDIFISLTYLEYCLHKKKMHSLWKKTRKNTNGDKNGSCLSLKITHLN